MLSCLLTEMDGLEQTSSILVLAATNQPQKLDQAFIRPGRIDMALFVGLPDEESRKQILKIQTKNTPLADDVNFRSLAQSTELFTGVFLWMFVLFDGLIIGAELAALCSEAALCSLREDVTGAAVVKHEHFQRALTGITPATTLDVIESYKCWGSNNKFKNLNPDH